LIYHRPAVTDVCDVCGGALVARADDTAEALQTRLREYHAKTEPILELFRRKELIVTVDGTKSPALVQEEFRGRLSLPKLAVSGTRVD
jgi:adenylate kinase